MKSLFVRKFKAFSYNELLLVSLLMAVVLLIVSPFVVASVKRNGHNDTENRILELIKTARRKSLEGYETIDWSICFSNKKIFISDPACSSENALYPYDIPEGIVLNDFGSITFKQNTGEVTESKTISVSAFDQTKNIIINQSGGYYEN